MLSKKQKKNEIDIEEAKKLMVFAATRYQQDFYELLSDWNEYDPKKPNILKNCIGTVLFGPPQADKNKSFTSVEDAEFVYKPSQMKKIQKLYSKIVEHGTQNTEDKKILCGLLYNVVFHKKSIQTVINKIHEEEDFNGDCLIDHVSPVPVFKVVKHTVENKKENDKKDANNKDKDKGEERPKTTKLEIYYIDDSERVYKSWPDYLSRNVLPPCVMVVPYGGEYQGDQAEQWSEEMSYVWVDVHESPACNKKILNALDTSNTVISFGSMALCVAAAFTPVGAAVTVAGGVGMGVSALWTIGRNSQQLVDRSKHDQSINVTNKEGLTCWFGIVSSALAVASSGGSLLLSKAIKDGSTITKAAQTVHDGVQISTVAATGVTAGLSAYNIYDNYKENQAVSAQELLNLAASLLLLGNSVVNLKLSRTMIESNQTSIIKDFEASLRSNRHRKEFQKMVKNTKSIVADPTKVKEQIIRGINKIQNKDEFFASVLQNKKCFASKGIKPAFIEGKFTINGKTLMNPVDFVKGLTKTPISMNPVAINPVVPSTSVVIPNENIFENALANFIARNVKELVAFVIPTVGQFVYVLTDISSVDKSDVVFSKLLVLGLKIAKAVIQDEYPATNLLVKAVDFLWDFIKASIRETVTELCAKTRECREIVMKVLIILYSVVETKLEEWVASFKEYLRIKLREVEDQVKSVCSSQLEIMNNAARSLLSSGTIS